MYNIFFSADATLIGAYENYLSAVGNEPAIFGYKLIHRNQTIGTFS